MAFLSHLSQWKHVGEQVPCREIPQAPERKKQNASKLVTLKNFNEELLSVADEQHKQLGVHAQSSSTNSESEAKEFEVAISKTTTALVEIANISQ